MTTSAENFQKAAATSWAAYGSVLGAWTKAVMDVYTVVLEWAVDERVYVHAGQTKVFLRVATTTDLRAELYDVQDSTKALLPQSAVTVYPARVEPVAATDPPTVVTVTVNVGPTGAAPAYLGNLVDAQGTVVEPDVYVSMMSE